MPATIRPSALETILLVTTSDVAGEQLGAVPDQQLGDVVAGPTSGSPSTPQISSRAVTGAGRDRRGQVEGSLAMARSHRGRSSSAGPRNRWYAGSLVDGGVGGVDEPAVQQPAVGPGSVVPGDAER